MAEKEFIDLQFPITVKTANGNDQEVSRISLGRLKAKHLKLLPKGLMDRKNGEKPMVAPHEIIPLVAGLAGITEDQAGEFDFVDLENIITIVSTIVGKTLSPKTGKK